MARLSTVPVVALLLVAPVAGCGVEHGDEAVSTDSAELRKLLPSEIAGTISYGQSKTVWYPGKPRYQALSFQATKGDTIDAHFVGAKGLDTIGFLLSSSFATLARNDDESDSSTASRLSHTISKTGTYYLAVREANAEEGDVTISLSKVGAPSQGAPSDWFNQPRTMSFECNHLQRGSDYTCGEKPWQLTSKTKGTATVQLSSDGSSLSFTGDGIAIASSWNKSYALDARHAAFDVDGSSTFRADFEGDVLTIHLDYDWTSWANWCGASSHSEYHCEAELASP